MKNDYTRQEGIFSPYQTKQQPITVIGAGGIGSPLVITLAKTGFENITSVDPDRVVPHNLPNQFYRPKDVGRPKVRALQDIVLNLTGTKISIRQERFTQTSRCQGIIISGVDTMASRAAIWEAILRAGKDVPLYIDARMGGQVICVHTVQPQAQEQQGWYQKTLYSDETADRRPCTARAIIYATMITAGLVTAQVVKFTIGEQPNKIVTCCLKTMNFVVE